MNVLMACHSLFYGGLRIKEKQKFTECTSEFKANYIILLLIHCHQLVKKLD
ncbi:hypothetical protein FX988_01239 [Paraglaciecola mesophila]|uniref:Uncharacterized protein n=1 Tax=Paraglaciecola mesophila TaxID=197222 RepID=A0A857JJ74_9ALTE|nr:hypothetical protein FX988_01239 [Paraglaciecola mesophila]